MGKWAKYRLNGMILLADACLSSLKGCAGMNDMTYEMGRRTVVLGERIRVNGI
jgi:hypothetical protein